MKIPSLLLPCAALMLLGCTAPADPAPSAEDPGGQAQAGLFPSKPVDAEPPYIVEQDCTFWLVTPTGVVSTRSARNSGPSGNAELNWGGYQMKLSDCAVVSNPQKLRIY
jgi:hypothetical protein